MNHLKLNHTFYSFILIDIIFLKKIKEGSYICFSGIPSFSFVIKEKAFNRYLFSFFRLSPITKKNTSEDLSPDIAFFYRLFLSLFFIPFGDLRSKVKDLQVSFFL